LARNPQPEDAASFARQNLLKQVGDRTPARILIGRSGSSYRTTSQLDLRNAHAAAVDAVQHELDLSKTLGEDFCRDWKLFEVATLANSKAEYLARPDRGRQLSSSARETVAERCSAGVQVQVVVGDGLSVTAVAAQVPRLLPLLSAGAQRRGWLFGQLFVVRYCRVGVLNDVGDLLNPLVTILLIGERPGLTTAESLSAYMAYRPHTGQTDADRNLISNIHDRGTTPLIAAERILDLTGLMLSQQLSGTRLSTSARAITP
jgi:ethanolamine ammonia-lyase small subunit